MRGEVGFSCNYTSLGYASNDVKRAIKTIYDLDADFFGHRPQRTNLPVPESDPLNRVSRPVAEWMATNPDFERITAAGDPLVLYRRRALTSPLMLRWQ